MKILLLVFCYAGIMSSNLAMANSQDEALFHSLAAAFPAALQYPGHFTAEIGVANLRCGPVKSSGKFECRAEDSESKEMIAKGADALVKSLRPLIPGKSSGKRDHSAAISFDLVHCSRNSERSKGGGQRQSYECSIERSGS